MYLCFCFLSLSLSSLFCIFLEFSHISLALPYSISFWMFFLSLSLSLSLLLLLHWFGWLVVILGGTDHWMWEWQDEHGLGEEENFHIDGWIMHNVIYIMTEGMYTLRKDGADRDGAEIYIWYVFISDSVTPCSNLWKRRGCRDSAAEWSQHQWKRRTNHLLCRNRWLREWVRVTQQREKENLSLWFLEKQLRGREWEEKSSRRREHWYLFIFMRKTQLFLFYIPFLNQSIYLLTEWCMHFALFPLLSLNFFFFSLTSFSLSLFAFTHKFYSFFFFSGSFVLIWYEKREKKTRNCVNFSPNGCSKFPPSQDVWNDLLDKTWVYFLKLFCQTPLHFVAHEGNKGFAEKLLHLGADKSLKNVWNHQEYREGDWEIVVR